MRNPGGELAIRFIRSGTVERIDIVLSTRGPPVTLLSRVTVFQVERDIRRAFEQSAHRLATHVGLHRQCCGFLLKRHSHLLERTNESLGLLFGVEPEAASKLIRHGTLLASLESSTVFILMRLSLRTSAPPN